MSNEASPPAEPNTSDSQRCMAAAVSAFNVLTGNALSEAQGWELMALLRLARINDGPLFDVSDYENLATCAVLAGEAAVRNAKECDGE